MAREPDIDVWYHYGMRFGQRVSWFVLVGVTWGLTSWTAGCRSGDAEPRLVVESLVNIADFQNSPSDWPVADPILIECWGGARERASARRRAAFRLKLDGFPTGSYDVEEIAEDSIASSRAWNRMMEEHDPFAYITLLAPSTGVRYGWRDINPTIASREGTPHFEDIDTVFPAADQPEDDTWLEQQARLSAAVDIFNALPVEDTKTWIAARTAVEQAREARDAALEAYDRDRDLSRLRDALLRAIQRDALNACGR